MTLCDLPGDREQILFTFVSSVPGKEPGSLQMPSECFYTNRCTLNPIKFSRNTIYCYLLVTKMANVDIKVNWHFGILEMKASSAFQRKYNTPS